MMGKTVVGRSTDGRYVVQQQVGPDDDGGYWDDVKTLPSGAVLRDGERQLTHMREFMPRDTYRLVYKRVETTYELEVGAHEDV